MALRRLLASALAVSLPASAAAGPVRNVPPEMAASPQTLLAQRDEAVDDSDLGQEESLDELNRAEMAPLQWSTPAAVGLSFIPGGGFGLVYAEKKAASAVPFLLSAAGFAVGALYLAGVFDTTKKTHCYYKADPNAVSAGVATGMDSCTYAMWDSRTNDDPIPGDVDAAGNPINTHSIDPNSGSANRAYIDSSSHYAILDSGENFDGQKTGIYIMLGTYAVTTLLGAVWSGLTVADHNEEIRKNIESTAQNTPKPIFGFDGDDGYFGLVWSF